MVWKIYTFIVNISTYFTENNAKGNKIYYFLSKEDTVVIIVVGLIKKKSQ